MTKRNKHKILSSIIVSGVHASGRTFGFAGPNKVFIDNAIPEENVDVLVEHKSSGHYSGKTIRINQPSAERNNPACRHFGLCGGCNWQHMTYDAQLRWKKQILTSALKKQMIACPEIPEVEPSPHLLYYRNKIEYSFSSRRWYYENEGEIKNPDERQAMGFHLAGKANKVLQISECHLQPEPGLNIAKTVEDFARKNNFPFYDSKEQTGFLRSLVVRTTTTGEIMAIVAFARCDPNRQEALMDYLITRFPQINSLYYTVLHDIRQNYSEGELINREKTADAIYECCNGYTFRTGPSSFFQPNPVQAGIIYGKIRDLACLTGHERIYDLYCGVGTISVHLAMQAGEVIGIESSPQAVNDAVFNARANKIFNARFICGDVLKTFTEDFPVQYGKPDVIVLDPPRSGTLTEIKKNMLQASPVRIIYLSCNPVSLARDMKFLTEKYRIASIKPYDMFPQTHQVETLVLLEKNKTA